MMVAPGGMGAWANSSREQSSHPSRSGCLPFLNLSRLWERLSRPADAGR